MRDVWEAGDNYWANASPPVVPSNSPFVRIVSRNTNFIHSIRGGVAWLNPTLISIADASLVSTTFVI